MHNLRSPSPSTILAIHPPERVCRPLTVPPICRAPTCFPAKLGVRVPLAPIISFCKECLCCSLCYSYWELLIWHSVSPCPVHFLISFVNLAQRDTEHPPVRCWAPSGCLQECLSGASQDLSLWHWQTKGKGWGERIWLNAAWHLFGPVPVSYCSAKMCHYWDCLHIICLFFFVLFAFKLLPILYFSWLFLTLDSNFFFKFSSKRIPLPALWALTYPKVGDPSFTHLPDRYCTPFPIFLQVSVVAKSRRAVCAWHQWAWPVRLVLVLMWAVFCATPNSWGGQIAFNWLVWEK